MVRGNEFGAVVLCGGLSTRMGRSKALLPFGLEVLAVRAVRIVREAVGGPIVVAAAVGQKLPPLPDDVAVALDARGARGPLEGLFAGLCRLRDLCEAAVVIGCDLPLIRPALLRHLCERLGEADAAVPVVGERLHPLTAVYRPRTCLPAIERLLTADRLRMMDLLTLIDARPVDEASLRAVDPELASLRNLNTPEEYEAALREADPLTSE